MPFHVLRAASLLSQRQRIRKFAMALNEIVEEGMSVADIGTGTGILALIAAQAGASRVVGIDVNGSSIEYARRAAQHNNLESKVEFKKVHFSDYFPKDRFDVVVCEMLSSILLVEQQLPAVAHINKHIRKEEGILLPEHADIYGILCESKSYWDRFEIEGLSFPRVPQTVSFDERRELSEIELLTSFDLYEVEDVQPVEINLDYNIIEEGIAHGLCGMFESRLWHDITLDMEDGWREIIVPFEKPTQVEKGEILKIYLTYVPGIATSANARIIHDERED